MSALILMVLLKGALAVCEPTDTVDDCIDQVEASQYDECIDQADTTFEECQ